MASFKQNIVNIADICAEKDVRNFVISAGSRSAPLTLALTRHPKMECRTVVDERSAAFIALGMAQQIQQPVGLICTSGTAALNYYPAIAEAFYQQISLLIFTADRPPEWIDQNDGQTINQREIYRNHCRAFFEIPVEENHPDVEWHSDRIISDAVNCCQWPIPGPVHINVPLREPLYPKGELNYQNAPKVVSLLPSENTLEKNTWSHLLSQWKSSKKKLIIAGLHSPNKPILENLKKIQETEDAVVLCDIASNMHDALMMKHYDIILASESPEKLKRLIPDLLVSFGGPVVSKNLKLALRQFKPKNHWQIQSSNNCIDTFQSLTEIIPVQAEYFFEQLNRRLTAEKFEANKNDTFTFWLEQESKAQNFLEIFLKKSPHSELSAMHTVLKTLPKNSRLQLGNSSIIRLANFVGLPEKNNLKVNSNRGTCGIDGTLSTAVGAALTTSRITTIILGDLAFFYDRNALWHDFLPENLRIIIFNNFGGGIFRTLDGSKDLPEMEKYFEVAHGTTAKNTAADHGLDYLSCDSKESLEGKLSSFFEPKSRAAILEVKFDKQVNADAFLQFNSMVKEI